MRVQQIGTELHIVLSPEAIEALEVSAGTPLEVTPMAGVKHRYATLEEGIAAFEATEHLHRNTYRELAK